MLCKIIYTESPLKFNSSYFFLINRNKKRTAKIEFVILSKLNLKSYSILRESLLISSVPIYFLTIKFVEEEHLFIIS